MPEPEPCFKEQIEVSDGTSSPVCITCSARVEDWVPWEGHDQHQVRLALLVKQWREAAESLGRSLGHLAMCIGGDACELEEHKTAVALGRAHAFDLFGTSAGGATPSEHAVLKDHTHGGNLV